MKNTIIKVYGERNTGTNYLHDLIAENLQIELLPGIMPSSFVFRQKFLLRQEFIIDLYDRLTYHKTLGWKHALVADKEQILKSKVYNDKKIFFVTITKNPYSWLLSLYMRPYHLKVNKDMSFREFIQMPWESVSRERSKKIFENPIQLWNEKNRAYMELGKNFDTVNVTYEDLLYSPEAIVEKIKDRFSLNNKSDGFKNIMDSTKSESTKFEDYRDYYLQEAWKEKLADDDIGFINQFLNKEILEYFKYEMIECK